MKKNKENRSLIKTILIKSLSMLVASILLSVLLKQSFLVILLVLESFGLCETFVMKELVLNSLHHSIKINKKAAERDSMTGICNRNKFIQRIDYYNDQSSIGVIFFDLNNLKKTNDKYGHSAGDDLLIATAEVFVDFRGKLHEQRMDYYRMGGDEFFVILPNIESEEKLKIIQNQILDSMSKKQISDHDGINISLAYGYAYAEDNVDIEELANLADEKMIQKKKDIKENHNAIR